MSGSSSYRFAFDDGILGLGYTFLACCIECFELVDEFLYDLHISLASLDAIVLVDQALLEDFIAQLF